jgi:hypothetical protein
MSGYSLNVQFAGICTHFTRGTVAGVPHRVVLPDATNILTGALSIKDREPQEITYYLTPHFPVLASEGHDLTVPGLILNGAIQSGVRLQVINARGDGMGYTGQKRVPKLTVFDPHYTFSDDVVVHGRAFCYFDFYSGSFVATPPSPTNPLGPVQVRITVETDGPPELLVTSLGRSAEPVRSYRLSLATANGEPGEITLMVKNLEFPIEVASEQSGGVYDYLLHFLTARGGIPRRLETHPPGVPDGPLPSATGAEIGKALEAMGCELVNASTPPSDRPRLQIHRDFLTPSCSDSQYP